MPSRLRDRVVADAARRQARRRWALTTVAAAFVAAIVGVGIGLQMAPEPQPAVALALESMEGFDTVSGWATVRTDGDELLVSLDVRGLPPLAEPEIYEAWLYRHDERIESIGQLEVQDGQVRTVLTVSGDLADYRGFWITAEPDRRDPAHEGPTVLRAPLPDQL